MITRTRHKTLEKGIYERSGPTGTTYLVRVRRQNRNVSASFDTLAEARLFRAKVLAETVLHPNAAEALTQKAQHLAERMTLSALLDWYEQAETVHKKGAAQERTRLNKLRRQPIARLATHHVRPEDVMRLLRDLRDEGLRDSSVYKYFTLLNDLFRRAIAKKVIPHRNPLDAVDRDDLHALLPTWKGVTRERRLTADEEARLIDALSRARNPQVLPFVLLLIATGCRRNELLQARWSDYDPDRGTLRRPRKMHAAPVTIPLSDYAIRLIESLRDPPAPTHRRQDNDRPPDQTLLFPLLSPDKLRSAWNQAVRRAGLADLRLHDLRHEAISRLFEAGFNIKEAQLVSGHRTVQSLLRYVNPQPEALREKLNRVRR